MPEVIFPGPAGRVEGRYAEPTRENAPIALILHAHPRAGGSMQDRVSVQMFQIFQRFGFAVLRFNFRGIGRSQGVFDNGMGELSDAASALDYLQSLNPNAEQCWVAGYSFGAWIGLQLLMRRPEIAGFIAVSPPANHYDLSFLAPCPSSGLVVYGTRDGVAPAADVERVVSKIRTQKNIKVDHTPVEGADHFYRDAADKSVDLLPQLEAKIVTYLEKRLAAPAPKKAG
ncbi:MAG: alpha/beta hydrolase [Alphaproteobacteria bacterium]|nr:alpha/beta hydrolase [Alphaproteobacteria bacterium]